MTPTMSLFFISGLVAGFTLLRWTDRSKLQSLPLASKRSEIFLQVGVCLGLAFFVWLFTLSVGTPLTDHLSVLILLGLEGLVGGVLSSYILFSRRTLHIPFAKRVDQPLDEAKDENIIQLDSIGTTRGVLPPGKQVVYSLRRGRWTSHDRSIDEEPNTRTG
ncbi:MAG: hypothetical protein JWP00_4303 [Chloroflexi bacterium]|nr:hypothetical protein [Chloroflexota bacterium]